MTPLPKRRLSKARQGKRRQAIKLQLVSLTKCLTCGQPVRPHTVCSNCGKYKSNQVINIKPPKKKGQ